VPASANLDILWPNNLTAFEISNLRSQILDLTSQISNFKSEISSAVKVFGQMVSELRLGCRSGSGVDRLQFRSLPANSIFA
jgi:hypothetical protein